MPQGILLVLSHLSLNSPILPGRQSATHTDSDSYMALQRDAMKDLAKLPDANMPVTNGVYDPHKLLMNDLAELKALADEHNAEFVLAGDFNEKWYGAVPSDDSSIGSTRFVTSNLRVS